MVSFIRNYSEKFVSRWLILLMDILVAAFSFILAAFIRFNFEFWQIDFDLLKYHLLLVVLVRSIGFYISKTYRGIVRHTSMEDAYLHFKSVISTTTVLVLISLLAGIFQIPMLQIPLSIIVIDFFI